MSEEPRDTKFPILDDIDRVIHEPARLLIMSHLYVLDSANFLFLKTQTGLSDGNLSSHITKLENAGYVEIIKKFVDRKPITVIQLTKMGREAFLEYQQRMAHIFKGTTSKKG